MGVNWDHTPKSKGGNAAPWLLVSEEGRWWPRHSPVTPT
jgi:hypothetical protein